MRKFSILATVALVVVAMLWGNCLSCPQMMAAAHSCCHKSQPASAACHTQGMQHFVKAEKTAPVAPSIAALADLPTPVVLPELRFSTPIATLLAPSGGSNSPLPLRV